MVKLLLAEKEFIKIPPERTKGNNSASLCEERIEITIIEFMSRWKYPDHKYLKKKKGNKTKSNSTQQNHTG